MAIISNVTRSDPGVIHTLPSGEELLLVDGVQVFSENRDAVEAGAVARILISSDAVLGIWTASRVDQVGDGYEFDRLNAINAEFNASVVVTLAQGAAIEAEGGGVIAGNSLDVNNDGVINTGWRSIETEDSLELRNRGVIHSRTVAVDAGALANIYNTGDIRGDSAGLNLGQDGDVLNFGRISGLDAVTLEAFARIENHGEILGASTGVDAEDGDLTNTGLITADRAVSMGDGDDADRVEISNSGRIIGEDVAIDLDALESRIVNSGLLQARNDSFSAVSIGIDVFVPPGQIVDPNVQVPVFNTWTINSGEIIGAEIAFRSFDQDDRLVNTGQIVGDVDMGAGDDHYRGRQGRVEGTVDGGLGEDVLVGGGEENTLIGGGADDRLRGRGGDDSLAGDQGDDTLDGGGGDDALSGGVGEDILRGRAGDDSLAGGDNVDLLLGQGGADILAGGAGGDILRGHAGDDSLGGGRGADLIIGGKGDDLLTGGQFTDTFVIRRRDGEDQITDFENGTDVIDLTAFGLFAGQSAAQVLPALSSAGGGASFLNLDLMGGQGSVLIQGLAFAQADASDFIL